MRTASCAKPLARHFEALYLRRLVDAHAHTHTHLHTHARAVASTSRTRHNVQLTQMTCLCGILLSAKLKAAQTLRAFSLRRTIKTDSPKAASSTKDISGCAFCGHKVTRKAVKNGTKRSSNVAAAWWHSWTTKGTPESHGSNS